MKSKYIKPSIKLRELDAAPLMDNSFQMGNGESGGDTGSSADASTSPAKEGYNIWDYDEYEKGKW